MVSTRWLQKSTSSRNSACAGTEIADTLPKVPLMYSSERPMRFCSLLFRSLSTSCSRVLESVSTGLIRPWEKRLASAEVGMM
ncbi:hypothetical protein D3C85_1552420 [compost metagenome]